MDGPFQPAHYDDLDSVRTTAWALLTRGVRDRKHAFHQAAVATIALDGTPTVRTVVLRHADSDAGALRFHTDARSRKVAELAQNPKLTLHFYDHGAKIQIRAPGTATLHNQDDVAEERWAAMRDFSKECYRQQLGPGETMDGPGDAAAAMLSDPEGFVNFVVVNVTIDEIEWLYLAAGGHRRALIPLRADAPPRWLAP